MKASNIHIQPASHANFDTIEIIHRAAFSVCEFGYNGEGRLTRELHENGDALVSLIALIDGIAVGHVLFSHMQAEADGNPVVAAALAPVGIVPVWQRHGVGTHLIKAGLAALKPQGVQLAFVVGNVQYYSRLGFSPELAKPFASPYAGNYFMAAKLDDKLQLPQSGRADFAAAFSRF